MKEMMVYIENHSFLWKQIIAHLHLKNKRCFKLMIPV